MLRKSDGSLTYFVPDIAYHIDKHERGFDRAIDVWGADHHGYIPRMRAGLAALGYPAGLLRVELVQLVKVMRGGEEVKMSKRAGEFVTLRDLVDEVGVDAARYFFLMRKGDSPARLRHRARQEADRREPGLLRADGARPAERHLPHGRARARLRHGHARPRRAARAAGHRAAQEAGRRSPRSSRRPRASASRTGIAVFLHELATVVHGWYHHTRAVGAPEGPATEQRPAPARPRGADRPRQRPHPAGHFRARSDVTR